MKKEPAVGVEPTLPCGNKILSLARLPISPRRPFLRFVRHKQLVEAGETVFSCLRFRCCTPKQVTIVCQTRAEFRAGTRSLQEENQGTAAACKLVPSTVGVDGFIAMLTFLGRRSTCGDYDGCELPRQTTLQRKTIQQRSQQPKNKVNPNRASTLFFVDEAGAKRFRLSGLVCSPSLLPTA